MTEIDESTIAYEAVHTVDCFYLLQRECIMRQLTNGHFLLSGQAWESQDLGRVFPRRRDQQQTWRTTEGRRRL